jgi:hypothetical protein
MVEVLPEREAEHAPEADRHVRISDEVEVDMLTDTSTVICLQFASYDEAVAFLNNEYDTVDIEETSDGCVFSSSWEDMGVTVTTEGAVSSDGLLYMVASSSF